MTILVCILSLVLAARPSGQNSTFKGDDCRNVRLSASQEIVELKGLLQAHALAGVVISPSGPVIPGVAVEIVDSRKRCLKTTTTDVNGRFNLKISKAGRYRVRLSRAGFNTISATVRVDHHTRNELRLELPMSN
jgi:hypothetical protein